MSYVLRTVPIRQGEYPLGTIGAKQTQTGADPRRLGGAGKGSDTARYSRIQIG